MMTPEQQRVAIAEWCGKFTLMPDYLHDLNAVHEAECKLTDQQWDDHFYHWLGFVVSGGQTEQLWEYRKLIVHATAAQRCEALCRTLWPERWNERMTT